MLPLLAASSLWADVLLRQSGGKPFPTLRLLESLIAAWNGCAPYYPLDRSRTIRLTSIPLLDRSFGGHSQHALGS